MVDFKVLSDLGLIHRINKEVLHQVGLALCWEPDTGKSSGALVADDFIWEYGESSNIQGAEKYNAFLKDRIAILTSMLKEEEEEI